MHVHHCGRARFAIRRSTDARRRPTKELHRPSGARGIRKRYVADPFETAGRQEIGVCSGEPLTAPSRPLSRNTVGERQLTCPSLIPPCSKHPCREPKVIVELEGCGQVKLSQVKCNLFLINRQEPDHAVHDLRYTDSRQSGFGVEKQVFNLVCCWLVSKKGDDRIRVQDRHRRRSRTLSAALSCLRTVSVVGPRPRYFPLSAAIGSSGSGRTTTRSPRSTTSTFRALHRVRALAGIETWPFLDTVMTWLAGTGCIV